MEKLIGAVFFCFAIAGLLIELMFRAMILISVPYLICIYFVR